MQHLLRTQSEAIRAFKLFAIPQMLWGWWDEEAIIVSIVLHIHDS
jgi:hypothetical protein